MEKEGGAAYVVVSLLSRSRVLVRNAHYNYLLNTYRMSNSVAGELSRMEGLIISLAVLLDKDNESNLGLPGNYVAISSEVLSRINGKVLKDQVEYFVSEVKRVLTSDRCLCLDGACRSCLALLPKLKVEVEIVLKRIAGGGKLFDGENKGGVLLAEIVDLMEAVKLVDAKDVHFLAATVQKHMTAMDENDNLV